MKPALGELSLIREQFQDPMEVGAPCKGVRDFTGIERRLGAQPAQERDPEAALVRENRFIQRMLDDRDRQFAALQEEVAALKRDWAWRTLFLLRRAIFRLRRQFWRASAANALRGQGYQRAAGRGAS
jgi:hypothetical protein